MTGTGTDYVLRTGFSASRVSRQGEGDILLTVVEYLNQRGIFADSVQLNKESAASMRDNASLRRLDN